jgi:mercuric ion transport protein
VSPPPRWATLAYAALAWLLVACLLAQVFIAGLAVFVFPTYWQWHATFVHAFEGVPLLMILIAWIGRLRRSLRWLPLGIFALVIVQYATANLRHAPDLQLFAALHPVTGFAITWLAIAIARRASARPEPSGRYAAA